MSGAHSLFPRDKFEAAKALLVTIKPRYGRYLSHFEPVPIVVPVLPNDQGVEERWRASIEIPDGSLAMYIDVDFANACTLAEFAGHMERALQATRRKFAEREKRADQRTRGEHFRIGARMEVASSLASEYERSHLRNPDALRRLLADAPTFGVRRMEVWDVHGLPVTDDGWMPDTLGLARGKTAESYARALADSAEARSQNEDETEPGDESEASGEGSGAAGGSGDEGQEQEPDSGEQQEGEDGESDASEESSEAEGESSERQDGESESGAEGEDGESDGESDSGGGERGDEEGGGSGDSDSEPSESGSEGDEQESDGDQAKGGDGRDEGPGQSGSDTEAGGGDQASSGESGEGSAPQEASIDQGDGEAPGGDGSEDPRGDGDGHEQSGGDGGDSTDNDGYEQLNTDNGQGSGRRGDGLSEPKETDRDAADGDPLKNEDGSAQSTGIDEAGQVASSDARTDRSSDSQGNISQSNSSSELADMVHQMQQEYPSLEWQSKEFRPEFYDESAQQVEAGDPMEQLEQLLEQRERDEAELELTEDTLAAGMAMNSGPAQPMLPPPEEVEAANEDLKERNIHWTDHLQVVVGSTASSIARRGMDDFTYSIRNPNQPEIGPILMGARSYRPRLYAVVDKSGSMLPHLRSEVEVLNSLMAAMREEFDAEIIWFTGAFSLDSCGENLEMDSNLMQTIFQYAGGGTSFGDDMYRLINGEFSFEDEEFEEPDAVVVLSDMEFAWKEEWQEEPDIPIIPVVPLSALSASRMERNRRYHHVPDWLYGSDFLIPML